MEHELKYDEENAIGVLIFRNHFLKKDVDVIFNQVKVMFENKPYRQLLVVMSDSHNVENRETREATTAHLANLKFSDIAFVGGSAANRMIAKVLIKTGLIKLNGDFFKDYEAAVNWLKSKR